MIAVFDGVGSDEMLSEGQSVKLAVEQAYNGQ